MFFTDVTNKNSFTFITATNSFYSSLSVHLFLMFQGCVCVCVCACVCVCTCVCALCVCVRSQCALSRASARRRSLSPSHSSACVDPSSPSSPGNDTWWSPWEQPAQEEKTWPLVNNRAVHQHGVAASVITRSERH